MTLMCNHKPLSTLFCALKAESLTETNARYAKQNLCVLCIIDSKTEMSKWELMMDQTSRVTCDKTLNMYICYTDMELRHLTLLWSNPGYRKMVSLPQITLCSVKDNSWCTAQSALAKPCQLCVVAQCQAFYRSGAECPKIQESGSA